MYLLIPRNLPDGRFPRHIPHRQGNNYVILEPKPMVASKKKAEKSKF